MQPNHRPTAEHARQTDQIPESTAGMENHFLEGVPHTRRNAAMRDAGAGSGLLARAGGATSIF